jgi:RNA 3'-terminal phosphate cyclase
MNMRISLVIQSMLFIEVFAYVYIHVFLTGGTVNAVHSGFRLVERHMTKLNLAP